MNINFPYDAIPLTDGVWKDDEITASTPSCDIWYSFPVVEGTTYRIWTNDLFGDLTKTLYALTSAWYETGDKIFRTINNFDSPGTFTATSSGTVYVRVLPANLGDYDYGTFAVVYNTEDTRPAVTR